MAQMKIRTLPAENPRRKIKPTRAGGKNCFRENAERAQGNAPQWEKPILLVLAVNLAGGAADLGVWRQQGCGDFQQFTGIAVSEFAIYSQPGTRDKQI